MHDTQLVNDVEVHCTNDACPMGRPRLKVPADILQPNGRSHSFLGTEHPGFFLSPAGNIFCCRKCWADYCDD